MNSPNRPAGSEPYIVAMANQADRSNRPTRVLVIASAVILAAIVYALFGLGEFTEGNARIREQSLQRQSITNLIQEIKSLRDSNPDLAALYPPADLIPNTLRQAKDIAFGGHPDDRAQPSDLIVSEVKQEPTETTQRLLNTAKVQISARGGKNFLIEDLLLYIDTAIKTDPKGLLFLSEFAVRTTERGWRLDGLEFRRYNIKR
ncbi:MAG: hypothetical protein ACIAQF_01025 [Phycisphaerales bacterium JB065]